MVDGEPIEEDRQIVLWCQQTCVNSGYNSNYFMDLWYIMNRIAAFGTVKKSNLNVVRSAEAPKL